MCFAIYTRSRFNEYKSKSFKVKSIIKSNRTQTQHILQFGDGYAESYQYIQYPLFENIHQHLK